MARLTEAQQRLVTEAVTKAEENTSGEIVTVLTDRSDGYTEVALLWAAAVAFTAMAIVSTFPAFYTGLFDRIFGNWAHDWTAGELMTLVTGIGLAKFFGMWLIQAWQPLKFFLIPSPVKSARANEAAVRLFKVGADRRTVGRTGVLLYLSLRERRAEIVADEAIAAKVPSEVWGNAMAAMLVEIKAGRIAEGMASGVTEVGKILAEQFPRADDDVNELPDRLIEL